MKKDSKGSGEIGVVCLAIGAGLLFYAWSMDVTVSAGGIDIVNLGKLDERRNYMLMGALFSVVGVFLISAFGRGLQGKEPVAEEPPCTRDLHIDEYKIWLVSRYEIEKNEVLGKFVCGKELFSTVEAAMDYAHSLELAKLKELEKNKKNADAEQKKRQAREEEEREKIKIIINFFLEPIRQKIRDFRVYLAQNSVAKYVFYGVPILFFMTAIVVNFGEDTLRKKYDEAQSRYADAYWAFESVNSGWSAARISVGKRLEADAKAKVKFVLVSDSGDNGHYVQVINESKYIAGDIDGELNLFLSGVRFPNNLVAFQCCQGGIAPGQTFTRKDTVVLDSSLSEVGKGNFAKINETPLVRARNGKMEFPPDSKVVFDGTIKFFVVDSSENSLLSGTNRTQIVDFEKESEKLPEVSALYHSDAAKLLETRTTELRDAQSKLNAWRQFSRKIHLD